MDPHKAAHLNDNFVHLRVIYDDLPDLIQIAVEVRHDGWTAKSSVYASPQSLSTDASAVIAWSRSPHSRIRIEAGADTGIGWLVLEFFTTDSACHVRCAVQLTTDRHGSGESRRLFLEMPMELGLVEQFGLECTSLRDGSGKEAWLIGLLT